MIISLILVLQLVKILLDEQSTAYTYFFNMVSCYQLLLLFWCVFTILIETLFLKKLSKIKAQLISLTVFLAIVSGAEGICKYLLDHPTKIPSPLFSLFKTYYNDFDRRIIQFIPAYTRYDTALFYELKGNSKFVFSNREFSDSFYTNSAGLRNDESALNKPEVVCIGDSYTLGWGNSQNDNYPARIEQITGKRVLNVSMSSYGTAREYMLLQKMDLSNVRYIFWQYCFNDEDENKSYIDHGFTLPIQTHKNFDSVVMLHKWARKYFPARHLLTILKMGLRSMVFGKAVPPYSVAPPETTISQELNARHFLDILQRLPIDFSKTRIIVFELRAYPLNSGFTRQVNGLLNNEKSYQEKFMQNLLVLDVSTLLRKEDYYILDDHLRQGGIEKVVNALLKTSGLKEH